MKAKQITIIILSIVLLLSVGSGVLLQLRGDQSGSISSLNEPKYDYVLDKSHTYVKDISPGARNGSISKIGSMCYYYSEVILTATLNEQIGSAAVELTKPNSDVRYVFSLQIPSEITFSASGNNDFQVYFCWQNDLLDPDEDPMVRSYLGRGRNILIEEYPEGYGGEEGWIEIVNSSGTLRITRMVVQMVPYTYSSGVSSIVATSKNLVDYSKATKRDGTPLDVVDNGVVFPAGTNFYFRIPVTLPAGSYVASYSGVNDAGESVGRYIVEYVDGSYSSNIDNGESRSHNKDIKSIWIYKNNPTEKLTEDLIVSNIQLEHGSVKSEYTPYFPDQTILEIPSAIRNLPGYGVGDFYDYNYIDLTNGTYVQVCKLVGTNIVLLDEPKVIDISAYLPAGSGNVDLYGVGSLIFQNPYDKDVPSEVAYRRIIN